MHCQAELGCQERQGSQEGTDHLEPRGNQQVGSHQEGQGSLERIQGERLGNHRRVVAAHLLQHQEQDPMILSALAKHPPVPVIHTARETGGAAPRPAGRATPGPDCKVEEIPPVVDLPSRVLGSAGGGDSTDKETM
ncbi:hypothetical protein N8I77_004809 [Diaporthe amygdali]|uniref:Uncharacterized protein n=1 Tax=Phomopsis amygdali TaxID=1214568 RepID=A0AAD9SP72_PHOAM|nr:hypothetical protein N8I77_004809 [Diaporthe amygdali]